MVALVDQVEALAVLVVVQVLEFLAKEITAETRQVTLAAAPVVEERLLSERA
jgi:hypothetical protein